MHLAARSGRSGSEGREGGSSAPHSRRGARVGAGGQKWAQNRVELIPLFEEGVVAERRLDLGVVCPPVGGQHAFGERPDLGRREEPIAADAHGEQRGAYAPKRSGVRAAL